MLLFIVISSLVLFGLSYVLPVGKPSSAYGSAYFSKKRIIDQRKDGLLIDGSRRLSLKDSYNHAVVVAPTGAGKTTKFLLPNILSIDNASQIITDPKGELLELCRSALERKGYTVRVLDFRNPSDSIQFNPLNLDTDTQIKEFASSIYAISNNNSFSESAIWKNGAITILTILLRAIIAYPDKRICTIATLIHLLQRMGSDEVNDFVKKYGDKEVVQLYDYIIKQPEKTFAGQKSTAMATVSAYDTKEIKQITSKTTFHFEELRKQKTALFLVLPVGVSDRYNVFLSLFYARLFRYLLNTPLKKNDLSVFALMEEFGVLKRIGDFNRTIALIRSQRVSISMIIQNFSQLRSVYGADGMETLLSNASTLIAYPGIREKQTLQYISTLVGKTTKTLVKPTAFSSFAIEKFSKSLLELDEIRTLDSRKGIFLYGNEQAQIIKPIPIFKNTTLMQENGIASVDGQLVVVKEENLSALPSDQVEEEDHLLDLEGLVVTNETADFKERLNDILS